MTNRDRTAIWWGLLLLVAVACATETGEKITSSTSAVVTTEANVGPDPSDVSTVPDSVVTAEAPTELSITTSSPNPLTTTTSSPSTTTTGPSTTTTALAITAGPTTTAFSDDLTVVEVVVREGRVVSEDRVDIPLGNGILMRFDSDVRLLVHVHGFNEEFSVEAGVVTAHEFDADLPGIFEVEDHVTHRRLIELKVSP